MAKVRFTYDQYREVWKHIPYIVSFDQENSLPSIASPNLEDDTVIQEMQIEEFVLPIPPIIQLSLSKNIVKTPLAGSDFTFKEIISANDYRINIKGFLKNNSGVQVGNIKMAANTYPIPELRELIALSRLNTSLRVVNDLFSYYNIELMVIEKISYPFVAGSVNYIPYEIQAISDENIELEFLNP